MTSILLHETLATVSPLVVRELEMPGKDDDLFAQLHTLLSDTLVSQKPSYLAKTLETRHVMGAVTDENKLLGAGIYRLNTHLRVSPLDICEVIWLAVDKDYHFKPERKSVDMHGNTQTIAGRQGKGIGRSIMQAIESHALLSGDSMVKLISLEKSRNFYTEKCGYAPISDYATMPSTSALFKPVIHTPTPENIAMLFANAPELAHTTS